jgi:methylmalonyl-CoA mutase N-terminal domain/subunit
VHELPGEYPFTRGIRADGYASRAWTMRQYAGFASAEETNERFRLLLERGQTGLSVAFDLPTQLGLDSDDPLARGEVGRTGVAIDSLDDMLRLFDGIPLGGVSTSMTINAPAAVLLLLYELAGAEGGIAAADLRGTVQNDVLKEYAARGNYIFPPRPSMRLTVDLFRYCNERLPRFNTISISGYHIREAGSSAAQELGFTLANGIAYVEAALAAGLTVDAFAPRLSFFFNAHNDVFAEVAKFRAARRIWATVMRERFGARDERSLALRFHAQTGGSTLTAQGPLTNVVRVALQAFAATAGGCQSLHTNGYDEALALPTERSATLALRTQQVLLHESGVAAVPDPFGGSEYVERLTDAIEREARALIAEIDELGGAVAAIESGWMKGRIEDEAFKHQRAVESGEAVIVGVNRYPDPQDADVELQVVTQASEQAQIARLEAVRAARDPAACERALAAVAAAARDASARLMEPLRAALAARCTVGEVCGALRAEWGAYDAQVSHGL